MSKVIVTTSWDDGHILDLKLAALLKKYRIKATFYISPNNKEIKKSNLLNKSLLKRLSHNFEIGAHTLNHFKLNTLSPELSEVEIKESKLYLEKLLDKKIISFCYPGGKYNRLHVQQVKKVGFRLARTTKTFALNIGKERYELPTTVHAYDHWSDLWQILIFVGFNPVKFFNYYRHWDILAMAMFDRVSRDGGVFHLWGHSWEVEKYNHWGRLDSVLKYISRRKGVIYLENQNLIND